ncbi:MAG TPA: type II secretion system F family protein [Thermoguttaceae bacterium]|nr:type II secretion system F family protein [Thermoguttaceae bacterium]
MQYEYTAKSTAGETVTGLLAASSPADVQRQLRERDLFALAVKPAVGRRSGLGRSGGLRWGSRVSKRELMALTSQLAVMTRAGIDLASALYDVARQCPNPTLKRILTKIHEDVLSGSPVSTALGHHEHVFGRSYVAAVAAAETAGRLPEVLDRLAGLLRTELRMRSTLRTLLTYPILLASVSGLVLVALMFFVLPQFAGVFEQLDIPLPAITQLLVGISTELRSRFWLWGGLAAGAVAAFVGFVTSATGHRYFDNLLLKLNLIRDVTQSLLLGRAFRLLGTMLESGVPLLEGLRLTRASIGNSVLRELFDDLEHEVVNGRGLANTFLSCPFVPSAAAQMIATAERTGTLAMVTQLTGEFYEEEGETRLRDLATVLEPLIIVVMGVVVAFVVVSVMLPVFDFAALAR